MQRINLTKEPIHQVIQRAVTVLRAGGLVIYPTETVYGAGVDATNLQAVEKLLAFKSRREGKPLSVAVNNQQMANQYVEVNDQAAAIYSSLLPGPVTVVSRGLGQVAAGVESEFGTLGIRISDFSWTDHLALDHLVVDQTETRAEDRSESHSMDRSAVDQAEDWLADRSAVVQLGKERSTREQSIAKQEKSKQYQLVSELVRKLGKPITATSANASGKARPYSVDGLLKNLSQKQKKQIDLILDAGQLPKNKPSTVIDTTHSTPVTLRQGGVTVDSNSYIVEPVAPSSFNASQSSNQTLLTSCLEQETMDIAGKLLLKHWDELKESGLVIGLTGPLGAGKTIFAKGLAKFLQIEDEITSPTYTYINQHHFERHGVTGQLQHIDLWKVDSEEVLDRLAIEQLIGPYQLVVIEWWQQGGQALISTVKQSGAGLILVELEDLGDSKRGLVINQPINN